jgi:hypothetical protein
LDHQHDGGLFACLDHGKEFLASLKMFAKVPHRVLVVFVGVRHAVLRADRGDVDRNDLRVADAGESEAASISAMSAAATIGSS